MKAKTLVLSLLMAALLLPSSLGAESKKSQADRELAKELSAALMLVSAEASKFADVRDQLAQNRLRTMQTLENSLIRTQERNDSDVRVWDVIGEDYRIELFKGVLEATSEIAARRKAAAEREVRQRQALAAARSAVTRKSSQLESAAASLAALAEPPVSGQAVLQLVQGSLGQLAASLQAENPKLAQGLELAEKLTGVAEQRLLEPPLGPSGP